MHLHRSALSFLFSKTAETLSSATQIAVFIINPPQKAQKWRLKYDVQNLEMNCGSQNADFDKHISMSDCAAH